MHWNMCKWAIVCKCRITLNQPFLGQLLEEKAVLVFPVREENENLKCQGNLSCEKLSKGHPSCLSYCVQGTAVCIQKCSKSNSSWKNQLTLQKVLSFVLGRRKYSSLQWSLDIIPQMADILGRCLVKSGNRFRDARRTFFTALSRRSNHRRISPEIIKLLMVADYVFG